MDRMLSAIAGAYGNLDTFSADVRRNLGSILSYGGMVMAKEVAQPEAKKQQEMHKPEGPSSAGPTCLLLDPAHPQSVSAADHTAVPSHPDPEQHPDGPPSCQ